MAADRFNTEEFNLELILFGNRLNQIREHRNLTLLQVEISTGIDESHLSKYESGKKNITYSTLWRLASAMNVTIKDLTDYDGPLPG